MDPEVEVAAGAESTSDDAAADPAESTSEEQSDVSGEPEGEAEGDAEGESEAEEESEDGTETVDDQDPEYLNLVKKFAHIQNERDRNAAIGKSYWEKTRYDSKLRKDNEELRLKVARLESADPKEDEPSPPPPADLDKAVKKIEALYQRGQEIQKRQSEIVKELNSADREMAIAEDRLKDVSDDDDRRPLANARVRQAKLELDAARDRYSRNIDSNEALSERLEQALAEKDWIERFHKDQAQRLTSEAKRHETFNAEFPQQVEALSKAAATHVGLKLNEKLSESLWRHVNRALQADIRGQYLDVPVEEIPVPDMVLAYVKEWAEDSDLVKRKTFTETSAAKLAVAKPAAKPGDRKAQGASGKPAPAYTRPAVPPALLSRDSSPLMARARAALVARLDRT
jgi:DNA repair exonuclease SbcCD ATPase subunit